MDAAFKSPLNQEEDTLTSGVLSTCTTSNYARSYEVHKEKYKKTCTKEPFGDSWSTWFLLGRIILSSCLTGVSLGSFALLYVEYTDYFQTTKAETGWINSLHFFSQYIFSE